MKNKTVMNVCYIINPIENEASSKLKGKKQKYIRR
jgi:hypothetical protein